MEESKMVLRTEDLVKKYGKRTVVSHVSINVKQGEIVGLLGPNGAGKTTSFYMTVGLITPNEGRIFLDDLEITKYPVYKRAQTGIGYLAHAVTGENMAQMRITAAAAHFGAYHTIACILAFD